MVHKNRDIFNNKESKIRGASTEILIICEPLFSACGLTGDHFSLILSIMCTRGVQVTEFDRFEPQLSAHCHQPTQKTLFSTGVVRTKTF